MNFFNPKHPEPSSPQPKPHQILQQALTHLQNHCSTFLHHHHHHDDHHHLPLPNVSLFKTQLDSTLSNLHHHAKQAIESGFSNFRSASSPPWARITAGKNRAGSSGGVDGIELSNEAVEERLAGIPVYALANSSDEFVLVSARTRGTSLGLFCFKEEDAQALLQQMQSMEPDMRDGSKVVAVALNKVVQLKLDGVAFRLIPELSQIKNALEERQKAGFTDESFRGVPVFQSKSLMLRNKNKSYRPVFFRKEDLENSLLRASRQHKRLNPAFKQGDLQVAALEDVIQAMKDNSTSMWDDVVFIPPGFDVSTDPDRK